MFLRGLNLVVFALSALFFSSGCTSWQLRKNTLSQMQTVHDIQQQQVLDNLAMFVCNPNSFPYFSIASQGTSAIADTGTLAVGNMWEKASNVFSFFQLTVNPTASRQATENWTLNPINDSVKLSVMHCAYQRAVGSCLGISPSCIDPNCNALFEQFYPPPKPTLSLDIDATCPTPCGVEQGQPSAGTSAPRSAGLSHVPGIVTPWGLTPSCCWFCWGPKPSVPDDFDSNFIGQYHNTYVWVPRQGRDQLTKLTLLILDIAYYDPAPEPTPPTVQMTLKIDGAESDKTKKQPSFILVPNPETTDDSQGGGGKVNQQTATVPLGTNSEAIKFAPDVMALKRLLATHGLTEDQLIDYWARGIPGPGITCQDLVNIARRLARLCSQQFPPSSDPPTTPPDWAPMLPCKNDLENTLNSVLPNCTGPKEYVLQKKLKFLARLWSRKQWECDGLPLDCEGCKHRLQILDTYAYRTPSQCNAFTSLGTACLDEIACFFLAEIPPDHKNVQFKKENKPINWADVRERLHDLEIPPTVPTRPTSPIPYAGIMGAATNLQNAIPIPTAPAPSH